MSKYNFELDMSSDNSNSAIINLINEKTKVVEFGPAFGRMTKYLKEQLDCYITIFELDYESGLSAMQYADVAYLEEDLDYISNFYDYLEKENFYDYFIFADVLEHLKKPEVILKKIKPFLKDDGSILVSLPNVSHNSILIDLLNDKFEYRDVGLLDITHLKFFTKTSFIKLAESLGYIVNQTKNLYNKPEFTEFGNSYDDVPEEVSKFLMERENGEVYQFIFELKKGS